MDRGRWAPKREKTYFAFLREAFFLPPFLAVFFVVLRVALRADFFEAAIGFAPSLLDFLSYNKNVMKSCERTHASLRALHDARRVGSRFCAS